MKKQKRSGSYTIKQGDKVGRNSYGKDIIFIVKKIIKNSNDEKIAILKGITVRIEADAPIYDLVLVEKQRIDNTMRSLDTKLENRVKMYPKEKIQPKVLLKRKFSRE